MASIVLLTVALMPSRENLVVTTKPSRRKRPQAIASVELQLPDQTRAKEVFLRIAAEFKYIAEALDPEALAAALTEGEAPK